MSETTEILFNSPGLHSLRRDQLQKLCKFNLIKANGKNTELVDRLRRHALTLPKDDPLSIAARSEMILDDEDADEDAYDSSIQDQNQNQSQGKQWEAMESIQEVEESPRGTSSPCAPRTIHSADELGTINSKTIVGSSIRALATSLGLKRSLKSGEYSTLGSSRVMKQNRQLNDELAQYSIPYSATRAATPPLNDNFTFDPVVAAHTRMPYAANGEPLPGCSLRPGEPAPDNARLSMDVRLGSQQQQPINTTQTKGLSQPTTTIRLVSSESSSSSVADNGKSEFESRRDTFQTPKLKPFATTFDLVMSPSASRSGAFWAPDTQPQPFEKIYPTLTTDDLPPSVPPSPIKKTGHGTIGSSASKDKGTLDGTYKATATTVVPPEPFVFGSPFHSVSNTQFQAAATSVLEEMNKRLGISGIEGVGMDIVTQLQPGAHTQAQLALNTKPLPSLVIGNGIKGDGEITKKFDTMHKAEFDKMEGIDGLVKRKMERKKLSSSSTTVRVAGKKRKSNVLGELDEKPRRLVTGLVDVADSDSGCGPTMKSMVPPGGFYDEDQEGRNEEEGEGRGGKRRRMDSDANPVEHAMDIDDKDDEEIKRIQEHEREREAKAIKRKLEISRKKRRSSVGGVLAAATKSAAVRNSKLHPATPKSKPSSKFGFLATAAKSLVASVWNKGKTPVSKPRSTTVGDGATAPTKSSLLKQKGGTTGFAPTKSSVNTTMTTVNAKVDACATVGTTNAMTGTTVMTNSRGTVVPVTSQSSATQLQDTMDAPDLGGARSRPPLPPSFCKSRTASSLLWASSIASGSSTRIQPGGAATQVVPKPTPGPGTSGPNSLTSSRLLAPTASSLAKMKSTTATTTLFGSITNSPRIGFLSRRGGRGVLSQRGLHGSRNMAVFTPNRNAANSNNDGKIFSKPSFGISVMKRTEKADAENGENEDIEMGGAVVADGVPTIPATGTRQRMLAKKPRLKVVAKLASQRAASNASPFRPTMTKLSTLPCAPRTIPGSSSTIPVPTTPKVSAGVRTKRVRSNFAPVKGHTKGGSADGVGGGGGVGVKERSVLESAKKRVRQSEYARRRSVRMNGGPLMGGNV